MVQPLGGGRVPGEVREQHRRVAALLRRRLGGGRLRGRPADSPASGDPHSMQNLAPAGFWAPQLGQAGVSSAPHDMQKRARSGFSAAQFGQLLPSIEAQDRLNNP